MFWLALIIAYLLGSISPAYILGRLIKKKDIRTLGTKNAGATNVFQQIGKAAGIFTCIFDMAKGIAAFWIAYLLMQSYGFSMFWVFLSGFAAIAGHNWPFYMQFRGGRGVATAYGLLFLSFGWLMASLELNAWIFAVLLVATLFIRFLSKKPSVTFFIFAPIFTGLIIFYAGLVDWTWFILLLMLYILVMAVITFIERGT
jgi:glycerol-3-phosphate acyltransferase PlsY